MLEIVPTILTSDINDFSQKIRSLRGICSRVQIDVIDGKFAKNKTLDLETIRDLADLTGFKIDLHLMVEEPQGWINRALAVVPDRVVAHVERMADPLSFVNEVVESGTRVGFALDLETPVEKISDDIYLLADLVLILAVKAGQSGQEFDSKALEKIEKIRGILGELGKIGVDGGVNEKNILKCKEAGADIFYVGGAFWQALNQNGSGQAENLRERYNQLLDTIK